MHGIIPVILAGGEGNRLKPLSSETKPKQFLNLSQNNNDLSLLQETAKRALDISEAKNVVVISSDKYKDITYQQLSEIHPDLCNNIILEPCSKNTAAAVTLAALHVAHNYTNPVFAVMPSDHYVENSQKLASALKLSIAAARRNNIVLFGIEPTRADSNYGYIIGSEDSVFSDLYKVNSFIEKPCGANLKLIMSYKQKWWNSGIFLMSTRALFSELKKKNLDILKQASKAYNNKSLSTKGILIDNYEYKNIKSISIDNAVIEESTNLLLKQIDVGWKDLGSWQSVWEISQLEGKGSPLENFLDKIARVS